jgi:hypothetical protein
VWRRIFIDGFDPELLWFSDLISGLSFFRDPAAHARLESGRG